MPNTNGTEKSQRGEGAKVLPKSLNRKQVLACALRPAGLPAPQKGFSSPPLRPAGISQTLGIPIRKLGSRMYQNGTNGIAQIKSSHS